MRKAVEGLIDFSTSALGEEVFEGVIGGGLASSGIVFSDASPEEKALSVLLAMGGGVGIGMGGRRIGASLGKHFHSAPLADQDGMIAMMSRGLGQVKVTDGFKDQMSAMSKQLGGDMKDTYISGLKRKAAKSPKEVAKELGIETSKVSDVLNQLDMLDEIISKGAAKQIPVMGQKFKELGAGIKDGSVSVMPGQKVPAALQPFGAVLEGMGDGLTSEPSLVTGEHLGRALGRVSGDEIGVLTGLASANLISQQMGFESDRDREVRKLNEKIKELGG